MRTHSIGQVMQLGKVVQLINVGHIEHPPGEGCPNKAVTHRDLHPMTRLSIRSEVIHSTNGHLLIERKDPENC